jgi:hypothetical protein
MTIKLTRQQREQLAAYVITEFGQMVERIALADEMGGYVPDEVAALDHDAVRAQLASWARRIPGEAWDVRLGDSDPNPTYDSPA